RLIGVTLAVLLGSACSGSPSGESDVGETRAPIIGGQASPAAHDFAVLIAEDGELTCTGALLAPNLVVTARHCIAKTSDAGGPCGSFGALDDPGRITVSVGIDADPDAPAARGMKSFVEADADFCEHDIGLVLLDHNVKSARVVPFRATAPH